MGLEAYTARKCLILHAGRICLFPRYLYPTEPSIEGAPQSRHRTQSASTLSRGKTGLLALLVSSQGTVLRIWVGAERGAMACWVGCSLTSCFACSSDYCSLHFEKTNLVGLLPEGSSADHETVLSDEASLVAGDTALAGILSEFSLMGTELVWHLLILARPFT